MKTALATIAGLALAGSALAGVDPTRPMVTGRGNVTAQPQKVLVTNQTAPAAQAAPAAPDDTMTLEKFVVTGSLIHRQPVAPRQK